MAYLNALTRFNNPFRERGKFETFRGWDEGALPGWILVSGPIIGEINEARFKDDEEASYCNNVSQQRIVSPSIVARYGIQPLSALPSLLS